MIVAHFSRVIAEGICSQVQGHEVVFLTCRFRCVAVQELHF